MYLQYDRRCHVDFAAERSCHFDLVVPFCHGIGLADCLGLAGRKCLYPSHYLCLVPSVHDQLLDEIQDSHGSSSSEGRSRFHACASENASKQVIVNNNAQETTALLGQCQDVLDLSRRRPSCDTCLCRALVLGCPH